MKNIFYSTGILFILLSITLTSCTQDTINKLVGVWTTIPIPDGLPENETWEFTSDGLLIVKNDGTVVSEGKYVVSAGFTETTLTTSEMTHNFNYYEAEWVIVDLKSSTLYINNDKDGGLYTKEFQR